MNGNDHNHHNDSGHVKPKVLRARDLSASPWVPGLVEIEFKRESDSGNSVPDFENPSERRKPLDPWPPELKKALGDNRLIGWKPSFPLTHPWSKENDESESKSRDFYRKTGRDRFVTLRFPNNADVASIAAQLRKVPAIARAKPVAKVAPPQISEPLLGTGDQIQTLVGERSKQWYAFRCNLPQALEQVTGNNVVIADIDWGFNRFHPDYKDDIKLRKNIYNNNQGIANGNPRHGTAVLGLAGARLNGGGIVGFAPKSILWAIQAGESQILNHNHWRDAIDFVRTAPSANPKVIILEVQTASEGNIEGVISIHKAISDAVSAGIVVCVPAGNGTGDAGYDEEGDPIDPTGSVLVGATSYDAEKNVVCSNGGESIVVYAPGDENHDLTCSPVVSEDGDLYTSNFGGTSGAVAKVAGAVALMLEANRSLNPDQVRDILKLSEIPVVKVNAAGLDEEVGVLLDCGRVVEIVLQGTNQ